jgi:hypothetical protein
MVMLLRVLVTLLVLVLVADSWSESVIVMAGGVDYGGEPIMLG